MNFLNARTRLYYCGKENTASDDHSIIMAKQMRFDWLSSCPQIGRWVLSNTRHSILLQVMFFVHWQHAKINRCVIEPSISNKQDFHWIRYPVSRYISAFRKLGIAFFWDEFRFRIEQVKFCAQLLQIAEWSEHGLIEQNFVFFEVFVKL